MAREFADDAQAFGGIAFDQRIAEPVKHGSIGDSKNARYAFGRDFVAAYADPGDDLIEEAHRVAHAARGFAGKRGNGCFFGGDTLLFEHIAKARGNGLRAQQFEVVALAAA